MRIEAVSTKPVKTARGMSETFGFKCDDGQWYNSGFKNPGVKVGDEVDFEFESTKYGNAVKFESIKVNGAASSTSFVAKKPWVPSAPRGVGAGVYTKPFPIPLLHGDRAIIRQNALTNARELVSNFYNTEGTTYNTEKGMKELARFVITVAREFEAYSAGDVERMEADNVHIEKPEKKGK